MFIKAIISTIALGLALVMLVPAGSPFTGYGFNVLAKQGGTNDAGSGTTERSRDREQCCNQEAAASQAKVIICKTSVEKQSHAIALCTKKLGKSAICTGKARYWTCR